MVTKCVYLYQYKTGNTIPKGWEKIWDGRRPCAYMALKHLLSMRLLAMA